MHVKPKADHYKGEFLRLFCLKFLTNDIHRNPTITYIPGSLPAPYISQSLKNIELDLEPPELIESCSIGNNKNVVLYVKCPPMRCGLRKPNEFRSILRVRQKRNPAAMQRDRRAEDRVVGGTDAEPLMWPFIVGIYRDGGFHCGGVIHSESWIITAAHCVAKYHQYYYEVRAGILRRFSYSPMSQTITVAYVAEHENYNKLGIEVSMKI